MDHLIKTEQNELKGNNWKRAGVHILLKISKQTYPPSEIFGWKIEVIKQNLIGLKGKETGNKILNKKYPLS